MTIQRRSILSAGLWYWNDRLPAADCPARPLSSLLPLLASWGVKKHNSRRPRRSGRRRSFEMLEARDLFSVSPLTDTLLPLTNFGSQSSATSRAVALSWSGFESTTNGTIARLRATFQGDPQIRQLGAGVMVSLDGTDLWLATGDPVLPVTSVLLALPAGTELVAVEPILTSQIDVIGHGLPPVVAPNPVPFDSVEDAHLDWTQVLDRSLSASEIVHFSNYIWGGYRLATVSISPIIYDHSSGELAFVRQIELNLTLTPTADDLPVNPLLASQVAGFVANPEILQTYSTATASPLVDPYEYVVVTSAALAREFEPLVQEKIARGLTARIVTTEWIAENYRGTENGDLADRIRQFLSDAYFNHGTRWVLLGGDAEVVPARGVYVAVGNTVETALATDMYYACLDGPWNRDGDNLWGERTDGLNGGDIDLVPELFVGRAPVSNATEARNFVAKTLLYATTPHPNATTALLLGEKLDSITQGSISNEIIRQQTIRSDWNVQTLYDSDTQVWTTAQIVAALNSSPNIVHHLGHANSTYVARMTVSQVATLSNAFPYFMYSQGCDAGAFDTRDVAIAEGHVVAPHGAVAVVMNTRYGWYVPGNTPGGSHDYALAFFDAIFNEHKVRLGEALVDSKLDNLFRLSAGGAYRWIHFTSTLFGDPELALQTGDWVPPQRALISGIVFEDQNRDRQRDPSERGMSNQLVYLDLNGDGRWNHGSTTFTQNSSVPLQDNGTIISQLQVSGVGRVHNLTVSINISHTYVADLRITLISPTGKRVTLVANAGGSGDNFTDTVFDDSASRSILEAAAPFTGTFRPVDPLGLLKDDLADGTWSLEVSDTAPWDTGVLNRWSLTFSYEEPYTVTDSNGAYIFSGLAAGDYTVRCARAASAWPVSADPGVTVSLTPGEQRTDVNLAISNIPSTSVDLGEITLQSILVDTSRPQLYRLIATHDGLLSMVVPDSISSSTARVSLYNAQGETIGSHPLSADPQRFDWTVLAGGEYYLLLDGLQGEIRLINLVGIHPGSVTIFGTSGDDQINLSLQHGLVVSVNGVQYDLTNEFTGSGGALSITANGLEGNDSLTLVLNDSDWYLRGEPGGIGATSGSISVSASGIELVQVCAGKGNNTAELSDSPGDDVFVCQPGFAQLRGPGFEINVENFSIVHAYSRAGGEDVAHLSDSRGDDRFVARPDYSVMSGSGFYHRVKGFRYVHAYSRNGGNDSAQLFGSTNSDILTGTPDWVSIRRDGYFARAKFFKTVEVVGNGGTDVAQLSGSSQQDRLVAGPRWLSLSMNEKLITIRGIPQIIVNGGTGWDIADLTDSPGDDRLRSWPGKTLFSGPGFNMILTSFEEVTARSVNGGADAAELWDSGGDDMFISSPLVSRMVGPGFRHTVEGFRYVHGYATAGYDTASLSGGLSATAWTLRDRQAIAADVNTYRRAKAFDAVFIEGGNSNQDEARLFDTPGNDYLKVIGNELTFVTSDWNVTLRNVPYVKAYGRTGTNLIARTAIDVVLTLFGSWV